SGGDDLACAIRGRHRRRSISGRLGAKCYVVAGWWRVREPGRAASVLGVMKLPRFVGIVDLAVLVSLAVALPIWSSPPPMVARDAIKGTEAERFAVAHAEAQVIANPASGARVGELGDRLGNAGLKDWAIEAAVGGARRAEASPDRWRALVAASVAYVERLDARPALEYIDLALASCEASRAA